VSRGSLGVLYGRQPVQEIMDLLTHTLLTRQLIGKRFGVVLAGVGPDIPWYATYPVWVIAQGKARHALTTGEWPEPPRWIETLHTLSHSLPIALTLAAIARTAGGRWPRQELEAWTLHIAEAHELEERIAHNVAQLLNGYSLER
jgi:hypothetical protein